MTNLCWGITESRRVRQQPKDTLNPDPEMGSRPWDGVWTQELLLFILPLLWTLTSNFSVCQLFRPSTLNSNPLDRQIVTPWGNQCQHTLSREAALKFEKDCVSVWSLLVQTLILTLDGERRKICVPVSELYSISMGSHVSDSTLVTSSEKQIWWTRWKKKSIRRRHYCAFTAHLMQEGLSLEGESMEIKDLCVFVCLCVIDHKRFGKWPSIVKNPECLFRHLMLYKSN